VASGGISPELKMRLKRIFHTSSMSQTAPEKKYG
jgi:hypothetical protein